MKTWPLQVKVGLYAAALSTLALIAAGGALLPYLYFHGLAQLDARLATDAEEMFRDLEQFKGAPLSGGSAIVTERFVPVALRDRLVELENDRGETLFRSRTLGGEDLHAESGQFQTRFFHGEKTRVGTFKHGAWRLHVGVSFRDLEELQKNVRAGLAVVLPVVALVALGGGLWVGHRSLRPLRTIAAAAAHISTETLTERLPVPPANDAIADLVGVLNETLDRLQRGYEASVRFSADASHQLKTPVAVLRAGLEELRAAPATTGESRVALNDLLHQTRRLATLVEDLLLLAQADAGRLRLEPAALELRPLLETALDDLSAQSAAAGLSLERELPGSLRAMADARRLALILQNLGENAVKFSRPGGTVHFTARRDGEWVLLTVANTGAAIPPDHREAVFERFRRLGGEEVGGHGLGLNIARTLARAHGGDLRLARSDGEWTEFELRLPAA